jgi:hypothetical protein
METCGGTREGIPKIVSAPGGGFRSHPRDAGRDDNARASYTRLYRFVPDAFAKDAQSSLLGEWKHLGVSSKPDVLKPTCPR